MTYSGAIAFYSRYQGGCLLALSRKAESVVTLPADTHALGLDYAAGATPMATYL
ncbi:MAG: hypothetical protein JXO72_01120 [Vicinamibacteria bacterium]|nr:hypothetical protein [Vicinamibacteria bacterium]